ncbi:hypothetical protein B1199_20820 [Pseudoalteromonas ulvae]|uniref:Uncharacterized protein n=1 Tax=Pseudoalteromonas ulvae TaxID=107327 RepID=A0A244CKU1_PSEDV|nr:hypothetical protein B1199_20820 [Pseudoalteromonas ulvae]
MLLLVLIGENPLFTLLQLNKLEEDAFYGESQKIRKNLSGDSHRLRRTIKLLDNQQHLRSWTEAQFIALPL